MNMAKYMPLVLCASICIRSVIAVSDNEVVCPLPKAPVDGKVILVRGGTNVGSMASYTCNEGRKMVGASSATCMNDGNWSSEPPICGRPCIVPRLGRGIMGTELQSWNQKTFRFVEKMPGSLLNPGEKLLLRCRENFELPVEELTPGDIEVECENGTLRPIPACHPAWCRKPLPDNGVGKPPLPPYNKENGSVIEYEDACLNKGRTIIKKTALCRFGVWIILEAVCEDNRCKAKELRNVSAEVSKEFYESGEIIEVPCKNKSEKYFEHRITCFDGQWDIKSIPCKSAKCHTRDLLRYDGIKVENRTVNDLEFYTPSCLSGYETLSVKLRCNNGKWESAVKNPSFCKPAPCNEPPPLVENAEAIIISQEHGSEVFYRCFPPYELKSITSVTCSRGQWSGHLPTCKDRARCRTNILFVYDGVKEENKTINHQEFYTPPCIPGYENLGVKLRCNKGNWENDAKNLSFCKPARCHMGILPAYDGVKVENGTVDHQQFYMPSCLAGYDSLQVKLRCNKGMWESAVKNVTFCKPVDGKNTTQFDTNTTKIPAERVDSNSTVQNLTKNCEYEIKLTDLNLLVFYDDKVSQIGSLPHGFGIKFGCRPIGMFRLDGPATAICINGEWKPKQFPKCVLPKKELDVVITFVSDKGYNPRPGDVAVVPEHSKIKIVCYEINRKLWPRLYHEDNMNISGEHKVNENSVRYSQITTNDTTDEYSGTYICSSGNDSYRISLFVNTTSGKCWPPPDIEHGIKDGDSYKFGSVVTYTCHKDYQLIGTSKIICQNNGQWSDTVPVCSELRCSIPPNLANGEVNSYNLGSEVEYKCGNGYKLIGNSKSLCMEDGNWSSDPPVCEEIVCPRPSEIFNGEVNFTDLKFGSEIEYTCYNGYKLVGERKSLCEGKGTWSNDPPICEEIHCPVPTKIPRGEVYFVSLKFGAQIEYICYSGYKLIGNSKSVCDKKGNWSNEPPSCEEIVCSAPPSIPNGKVHLSSNKFGSEITYSCDVGYILIGNSKSLCEASGNWSNDPPVCKAISCSVPQITNGEVYFTSLKIGSEVEFACFRGYKMIGNTKLICQDDGNWNNHPPICEARPKCAPLKDIVNGYRERNSTIFGSTVTYKCHRGYRLIGAERITCLENRRWSSREPICIEVRCRIPPQITNGEVNFNSLRFGSEIEYICYTGYEMKGNSKSLCGDDGNWSDDPPKCEANCSPPPDIENGNKEFSSTNVGNAVTYTCHRGYRLIGAKKIICQENGQWSHSEPVCIEIRCPVPTRIFNGEITYNSLKFGSEIEYKCNKGYKLIGNSKLVCGDKGSWDNEVPFCEDIICSVPPAINNGEVYFTSLEIGSEIEYTCYSGYKMTGNSKSQCDENGNWSNQPPVCEDIPKCWPPRDIEHGYKEGTSVIVGSTVTYKCNRGYRLIGEEKLTCQVNGQWSAKEPVCTEVLCPLPFKPPNSVVYFTSLGVGSEIEYECDIGFKLNGNSKSLCEDSGRWSNKPPVCEDTKCPAPAKISNGEVHFNSLKVSSTIEYTCNPGYKLIGSSISVCEDNGNWRDDPPTCIAAECVIPWKIKNGHKQGDSTEVGSVVRYTCDQGFQLIGSREITCQENGLWSNREPICEEIFCPAPARIARGEVYFDSLRVGSKLEYICNVGYKLIGNRKLICKDNGKWSGSPPTCEEDFTRCLSSQLVNILPDDVFAVNASARLSPRSVVQLACQRDSQVLIGGQYAICLPTGYWKTGDPKCVSGCYPVEAPPGSSLIIEGKKDVYEFGDELTFSCAGNKKLSIEIERIVCLATGWSDYRVPRCLYKKS